MIEFGSETYADLSRALELEWLESNAIGGFASSTIACANTRRYHGLLTAALENPPGRFVLLSKLEATVLDGGSRYPLSCNIYPRAIYPAGFQFLSRFRLDPFPVFTFEAAGRIIEKRLAMAQGENTVVVEYRLVSGDACTLDVRPLTAFRGYHELTHENDAIRRDVDSHEGGASIQPYAGMPRLFFSFTPGALEAHSDWYRNFVYPRERERGLNFEEDLYSPFILKFELHSDSPVRIVASTRADRGADSAESIFRSERARRSALRAGAPGGDAFAETLFESSAAFLVRRPSGAPTVIAGYHWFTDWGRDTMISLPGLTLVTSRFEIAKSILLEWTAALDCGMLPNRFPDAGAAPEYNTVDAALWLFEAVRKYIEYTGDLETVRRSLYKPLLSVIDWYTRGTRFGIRCDTDGLVVAGDEGTQLTWMDAMVNGRPATPRHGKPVEIQALWYNALRIAEWLAREVRDNAIADELAARAKQVERSFASRFWNAAAGCLFDVIDQPGDSAAVRPNQVIAMSLGFPLLTGDRAAKVLSVVERDLLTPFGLRTLAPSDPQYRPHYEGGVVERDNGYHQGPVWPWLMGHYVSAFTRVNGRPPGLGAFEKQLADYGVSFIPEILDGDPPHHPRGCIAQAWSVAEILRAYMEEVRGIRPERRIGL